jgi:hypothetical protein
MPTLPSGLRFGISRNALFDHGGNWFNCPDGYFWYWVPDVNMGPGPFESGTEIVQVAQHAPTPKSRDEAKKFIHVLEFTDDTNYVWRGEWLDSFPRFQILSNDDIKVWNDWLNGPSGQDFLDKTIEECQRLAEVSRHSRGFAVVQSSNDSGTVNGISGTLKTSL